MVNKKKKIDWFFIVGTCLFVFFLNFLGCGDKTRKSDKNIKTKKTKKNIKINKKIKNFPKDMVLIPAGEFVMGTNKSDEEGLGLSAFLLKPWYADESPKRKLYLDSYFIDIYEVTNKEYKEFVDRAGSKYRPIHWENNGTYFPRMAKLPVIYVTWYEANDYCFRRRKRLPYEVEWEKAARGPKGNMYPWGNTFNINAANIAKKSGDKPSLLAAGSFESGRSPYGLYDMIGNVWEWIYDEYKPYPGSDYEIEEFDKGKRVVRGLSKVEVGHYPDDQYREVLTLFARAGYRSALKPLNRYDDVGFRCVIPLSKKPS